jgi:hypothetical protein
VGLANLGSESETWVGSRVCLVGVFISFEKNFYRLPFTPPPPSLVRRIGPSQVPLATLFSTPPVVHVYSHHPPAPESPAEAPPQRSSIFSSPTRYIKASSSLLIGAIHIPSVANSHGMATHMKTGYRQPRVALHVAALPPLSLAS